jgi:rhodanese-related sulfurtransferase/DNA-binding transcriptional ArsR family regulator
MKDQLYEQVARIGQAVSNPKRLELMELLAQGEKAVETLAAELSADIKLTSAHLKVLREARLVVSQREGKRMVYRLSGEDVATLGVGLRRVAEAHLLELGEVLKKMLTHPENLTSVGREALLAQARSGDIVVIDVRPRQEYDAAHLPFARSMPLAEIEQRLAELPPGKEIVAYCRGPFCLMSDQAVSLLSAKGFPIRKIREGVSEWQATGMPVEAVVAGGEVNS